MKYKDNSKNQLDHIWLEYDSPQKSSATKDSYIFMYACDHDWYSNWGDKDYQIQLWIESDDCHYFGGSFNNKTYIKSLFVKGVKYLENALNTENPNYEQIWLDCANYMREEESKIIKILGKKKQDRRIKNWVKSFK